jgi:pyrimidine-nucleoside phosphorylase
MASALARAMVAIGTSHGLAVVCELTDMEQPLGRAVGNALEVAEAIATLNGKGPADLTELALVSAAEMLVLGRRAKTAAAARRLVEGALAAGGGLAKLKELVECQGGDARMVMDPSRLPRAPRVETLRATRTAYVRRVNAEGIGVASVHLGAGREKKGDPIDHRTGIVVRAKIGARVERGAPFAEVHHAGRPADKDAIEQVRRAFAWSARPVTPRRLVLGRVSG